MHVSHATPLGDRTRQTTPISLTWIPSKIVPMIPGPSSTDKGCRRLSTGSPTVRPEVSSYTYDRTHPPSRHRGIGGPEARSLVVHGNNSHSKTKKLRHHLRRDSASGNRSDEDRVTFGHQAVEVITQEQGLGEPCTGTLKISTLGLWETLSAR